MAVVGLSSAPGQLACSCAQLLSARPPAVHHKRPGLALPSRASGRRGRPALRPPCAGDQPRSAPGGATNTPCSQSPPFLTTAPNPKI
jgi:hypothetical protein